MSHPSPAPTPELERLHPGDVLEGRYRIDAFLGGGGMASVYRATHVVLEQPVALKVVSPQIRAVPGVAARFIREARAATSLKGEHVARVFDVGSMADGAPYMVMEFLEGKDLGELLDLGQRPSVEDAVDWVLQACEALAEVHGRGIVHRDLKPANLFLTRGADGRHCIKLIDFGISRFDTPLSEKDAAGLTHPEAIMGSPKYMSPESMESAKNSDARSDIWGLGAVLYELLTGKTPYDGESVWDIYVAARRGPPPTPSSLRSEVPAGLDDAVLRCLRADPAERFEDVAQLAAAIAPYAHEGADEHAAAITRVLDTSRGHANGTATSADESALPLLTPSGHSRVRPRLALRERARWKAPLAALAMLTTIGGIVVVGARARVEHPAPPPPREQHEEESPAAAASLESAPVPVPAPAASPPETTAVPAPAPSPNKPIVIQPPASRATPPVTSRPALPPSPQNEIASPPPPDTARLFEDRK